MGNCLSAISTLDDLRSLVQRTICDRHQLLPGAFHFHEKVLAKHGKRCGLCFILFGPRSVTFSAIWDATGETIFFYDCKGQRFHQCVLYSSDELREEFNGLTSLSRVEV
jgi:hypothetical protein